LSYFGQQEETGGKPEKLPEWKLTEGFIKKP
jgi:hypothetical protein